VSWANVEQVPGGDQVEGGIGGAEPADIDDPGQTPVGHKHVARDQVAVRHDVPARHARQGAEPGPELSQRLDVEQATTARQAGVHPVVVVWQRPSSRRPAEGSATGRQGAYVADELGQVVGVVDTGCWLIPTRPAEVR
jgi:hypothetical protein